MQNTIFVAETWHTIIKIQNNLKKDKTSKNSFLKKNRSIFESIKYIKWLQGGGGGHIP